MKKRKIALGNEHKECEIKMENKTLMEYAITCITEGKKKINNYDVLIKLDTTKK